MLPSTETGGGWWPAPRFCSFVFGQDIRRPRAEAVSWQLLRLETASDAVLTRKAVSSAYTRSLGLAEVFTANVDPRFVFHVPQDPIDGDTEEGWCQDTALPYA